MIYELRLYNTGKLHKEFEFNNTSAELAKDHAQHCMFVENADVCHFRKKGNLKWKVLTNNKNKAISHGQKTKSNC